MAIVPMSKFNLFSFTSDREELLKQLQRFQYVHFNDLDLDHLEIDTQGALQEVEIPERLVALNEQRTKAKWVIELLESYKEKESMIKALRKPRKTFHLEEVYEKSREFDFDSAYNEVYSLDSEKRSLEQEILNLKPKIDELYPWRKLNIEVDELKRINSVKVLTGMVPERFYGPLKEKIKDLEESYLEVISFTDKNYYLLGVSTNREYDKFLEAIHTSGFSRINIPTDGLVTDKIETYKETMKVKQDEIEALKEKINDKVDLLKSFQLYYDSLNNYYLKESVSENFFQLGQIDIIEGYVPTDMEKEFREKLENVVPNKYYLEIKEADREDPDVPIILENNHFVSAFEGITEMYALPKYNEIDPTPLLAPFYAFFAGMMIGDAGYGLLMVLVITIALKVFNLDEGLKRNARFLRYISYNAIFWGLIYGSVFGGVIELPAIIDTSTDYTEMMLLSVALGGVHLFFSVGVDMYMKIRDKKIWAAVFDNVFWYLILISVIILVVNFISPGMFSATVMQIAKWTAIAMAIGIILTNGREAESWPLRIAGGAYELYGISSWLGDFVSYVRLMALGLSGGFIGVAINIISGMMLNSNIVMALGGIVIFVLFHLFNIFLSYLSAYVHSARLIFVEMFNKFYEGGGKPFKGLLVESKYFNIENNNRRKK